MMAGGDADLTAQDLLARFAVYGRFYAKKIAGVEEQLRDRLEIAPRDRALNDIVQGEPDLLVVMMNPGASQPLGALWDVGQTDGFVAARPDRTQYQIMRLLLAAQGHGLPWTSARVVNLSDLRTPKSAVLLEKLKTYSHDDSHSLFSKSRQAECRALFGCLSTPVLCAWGLSPDFRPFASAALAAAGGHRLLGLTPDGLAYRHPLPQRHDLQLEWLSQLSAQINKIKPVRQVMCGS
jgi:hypothetical protein